ncbi:hypothetical protein J3459_018368 [Metarhizium acridum]|nr:hypothetical protein J3459_018368 [Metarhizium acridum]
MFSFVLFLFFTRRHMKAKIGDDIQRGAFVCFSPLYSMNYRIRYMLGRQEIDTTFGHFCPTLAPCLRFIVYAFNSAISTSLNDSILQSWLDMSDNISAHIVA